MKKKYSTVTNEKALIELVNLVETSDLLSVDLVTTSVYPMTADIVGISLSVDPNSGFYIPILYPEKKNNIFGKDDLVTVLLFLKKIIENSKIKKVGQNIKFDTLILSRHGLQLEGIYFDTMIAAQILNPSARSYKLDTLSLEYLNYNMVPIEDLIGTGREQITMDKVPLDKVTFYASEDADIALQLAKLFIPRLEENNQMHFFQNIEMPLVSVLMQMEKEGV